VSQGVWKNVPPSSRIMLYESMNLAVTFCHRFKYFSTLAPFVNGKAAVIFCSYSPENGATVAMATVVVCLMVT
jgi:hypothetical protein